MVRPLMRVRVAASLAPLLDFVYPPAVDAKNAKAGILTLPFSNNEEKEKAVKAKKEADAAAAKKAAAEVCAPQTERDR